MLLSGKAFHRWQRPLPVDSSNFSRTRYVLRQLRLTPTNLFNTINGYCVGHNGPARSVYVQDSEHCFLSASKDKTVKLWSLSNHGDGTAQSASSWTYARHTRPVFHVNMVESVRQGVSCDGSLHVSHDF